MANLVLSVLFLAIGSMFDACMDKMAYHYDRSIFSKFRNQGFWDPNISWINKWTIVPNPSKPKGVEKFWGSSRWFVAFTDGWHTLQFFQLYFYASAAAIWVEIPGWNKFIVFNLALIAMRLIMGLVFVLFFDHLLIRRK